MTPQERQLVDELFDRLSQVESAPRDPDAASAESTIWRAIGLALMNLNDMLQEFI